MMLTNRLLAMSTTAWRVCEGGRKGGKEGGKEGGREGGREEGKDGGNR